MHFVRAVCTLIGGRHDIEWSIATKLGDGRAETKVGRRSETDEGGRILRLLKRSGEPYYELRSRGIATSFDRSVVQFYQVLYYRQPYS